MKQFFILSVCLAFVVSVSLAYAAPVGNIATPSILKKGLVIKDQQGQFGVVAGPEVDITWDQNFDNQDDDTEYYFYGGKSGILIADMFILYGIAGAAEAKKQIYSISGSKIEYETDFDFAWGAGATAMLYQTKPGEIGDGILMLGVDGRFRYSDLEVDSVVRDGTSYQATSSNVTKTVYELAQWQIALAIAYQIKEMVPYVGVKYSDADGRAKTIISDTVYKVDFEQDSNIGVFVGGDIILNDMITANVEGRFIDETALTVSAAVRF